MFRTFIAVCASLTVSALSTVAFSQQDSANEPVDPTVPPPAAQQATPASDLEEVQVTGTRIISAGYQAPTPITVATVAQLQETTPTTIPDALNKLPVFQGSQSVHNLANGSSASTGNVLNLRNFGTTRTLVLENGLRVPPTNFLGEVDTNTIPELLVQRVDIVTGGASAVYGSDAITGVVNFVLDTKFEGLKLVGDYGQSQKADNKNGKAGFAFGHQFEHAHLLLSYEHFQNGGIEQADRAFDRAEYGFVGAGTSASPYVLYSGLNLRNNTQGGYVSSGPFAGQQFLPNGQLAPCTAGVILSPNLQQGGCGGDFVGQVQNAPERTDQFFGRMDFDVSDDTKAYIQTSVGFSHTHYISEIFWLHDLTIYSGNPFLPAAAQAQLTAAGAASFTMNRISDDLNNTGSLLYQTTSSVNPTFGLTGTLFGKYKWNIAYNYGEGRTDSSLPNNINNSKFLAAADAVTSPTTGQPVCAVSLTQYAGLYPGCTPLNLFGVGAYSTAAFRSITTATRWQAVNKVSNPSASISGDLIQGWAGPISGALSGEYRYQSLTLTSDHNPLLPPDLTGLRNGADYGMLTGGQEYFGGVVPQSGHDDVKEGAVEFAVPLLKGLPGAQSLEANLAYRFTEYRTGSAPTWKVGLVWQPLDDIRVRAAQSRDIMEPTLFQLFSGATEKTANFNDAHTGVQAVIPVIGSGNPKLVPEKATTKTIGVVLNPHWVPNLDLSVDYYTIRINNAIGTIAGNDPAVANQCNASSGTSPVCAVIVRPNPFSDTSAANFPTELLSENANLAMAYLSGIDYEASYHTGLGGYGDLSTRVLYSYQMHNQQQNYPGAPIIENAGVAASVSGLGDIKNRVAAFTDYSIGDLGVHWQALWSGSAAVDVSGVEYARPRIGSSFVNNLAFTYQLGFKGTEGEVFLAINNVFDKQPRIDPPPPFSGVPGLRPFNAIPEDDVIGRAFTVGFRAKLF